MKKPIACSRLGFAFFCLAVFAILCGQLNAGVESLNAQPLRSEAEFQPPAEVSPEGVEDGHAASSPNDSDLGEQEILDHVERYEPFTALMAVSLLYTSNVALASHGERSDLIVAPAAAFFYQPQFTPTLYGLVDVRQQFFFYDRFNAFDFASMDVEAGLTYFLPEFHNLILRGEYDFNRLTFSDRVLDEFFENHSIILNAEVPFRFSRAHQLSLGADANLSVAADHQSPRRNNYEAYAFYSLHLTRAFSIESIGRVVERDYNQNDRTDLSEILSLTANYRLMKWWTVSAISSFAHSDSNHDVFDYNVVNVGGALSLSAKF